MLRTLTFLWLLLLLHAQSSWPFALPNQKTRRAHFLYFCAPSLFKDQFWAPLIVWICSLAVCTADSYFFLWHTCINDFSLKVLELSKQCLLLSEFIIFRVWYLLPEITILSMIKGFVTVLRFPCLLDLRIYWAFNGYNGYNGYNGGWPSARLFGWSAADWFRPATNKSISPERKRKILLFCWERKSWTSWLLTCCGKKGWAAEKSSKKGVNRKDAYILGILFDCPAICTVFICLYYYKDYKDGLQPETLADGNTLLLHGQLCPY